jgi:hypothetical protein
MENKIVTSSRTRKSIKTNNLSSKLKQNIQKIYRYIKDFIFRPEIIVKGEEPPKSYSFKKKFIPLYVIFLFYSFVLILGINSPDIPFITYVTFGNPFTFSMTIISLILTLSFLYSNDIIRVFIFENYSYIKQPILYIGIILLYYYLLSTFASQINFISFLLVLSLIWIILLGSRFFIYSRKFATKIEARFISKYSIIRYGIALIVPLFILAILAILGVLYRSFLFFLSLIFFAPFAPIEAQNLYDIQMRLIMPIIYFSLVMTFVFIIFEFVSTRRKAETKRVGTFDIFTFSLVVFFIFFFQIFQISIYLLLRPEFVDAIKATVGSGSATVSYIFLFEFIFSSIFLYRIIIKLGRSYGWRVLFFKKDGMILFFLGCVLAQTLSRYSLATNVTYQDITLIGEFLLADKLLISIIMIIFLGATLLIYYIKPHETSMFMRLQKETVNKEEKAMKNIKKLIQSEYIRRGEAYPLEILERELIKSTKLSKAVIYSLIHRLAQKDLDMNLLERRDEFGRKTYWIDYVSVFTKYNRKSKAEKKAKKFLSEKLIESTSTHNKKRLQISKKLESDKASDQFLASLASGFEKKVKDDEKKSEENNLEQFSLKPGQIPPNLRKRIIEIIKEEFRNRIENSEEYPELTFPISEIVEKVQLNTKISAGELYPLLNELNDIEINLIDNPQEPEDKKIDVRPFADEELLYLLNNFRPEDYYRIRLLATDLFIENVKVRNFRLIISNLKNDIPNNNETQRFWFELLKYFENNYRDHRLYYDTLNDYKKMEKIIKLISKGN